MATGLKTKLLSVTRASSREPSLPAPVWMKVLVFVYLSAWIGVVALIGFGYMSDDSGPGGEAVTVSTVVADGGVADGGPSEVQVPPKVVAQAAEAALAGRAGPAGSAAGAAGSSGQADGGAAAGGPSGKTTVLVQKDSTINEGKPRQLSDRLLFIWVVLLGIMGGALHGLSSAAMHIGRRRFYREWLFFYLSRPPVGGATAAVLYLLMRGGIAGLQIPDKHEGEFTMMAWGAMAGLFSTVAMQKLRDIFDALFRPNQNGPAAAPPGGAPVGGPASPLPPAPVQTPTTPVASPPEKK
jgi:hypothetical protein